MLAPVPLEIWLASPDAAALLDPSRLEVADRAEWESLHTARRRQDWASSRALLATVGVTSDEGRSLSHSHGFAALARAPGMIAVGVDVEWLAPRDFMGMARVAYSAIEADHLASLRDPQQTCAVFYELWTLKEAFAKALRLPLLEALRQCCFPVVDSSRGLPAVPTARPWRATVFAPRPQLRLALVAIATDCNELTAPCHTLEWPPERRVEWPVVRQLVGNDGRDATAW